MSILARVIASLRMISNGSRSPVSRIIPLGFDTRLPARTTFTYALVPSITLQAVSKHLQVLERAGLVTRGRVSRQRPAHLRAEPIAEVTAWLAHYRRFYEESLDRLGEHLSRLQGS